MSGSVPICKQIQVSIKDRINTKKESTNPMSNEEKSNAAQLIHKQANMLPTVKSNPKTT